jgi:hypothetical protein
VTLPSSLKFAICLFLICPFASAQQSVPSEEAKDTPQQELHRLEQAVSNAQAQVEASQRQLIELQKSLLSLEMRLAKDGRPVPTEAPQVATTPVPPPPAQDDDIHERQAMQESQIATLDQAKVGSESKYPVTISGLVLMNSFINTSQVDMAAVPAVAIPGAGSTGASLRQTVLGIDARGPTLAGAASHADVRVDFFGSAAAQSYADVGGIMRLRTAHASLDWAKSRAFVEIDRPIFSPNIPTSLVSVAEPALSWSGNLWTWLPQLGVSHTIDLGKSMHVSMEAALMDVPDSPAALPTTSTVSQGERSRWPGSELHFSLFGKNDGTGAAVGVGGYFSPHTTSLGTKYDAWAGTLDLRLPLPKNLQLTGSFYRGLALGGLGGGAYKDYIYLAQGSMPLDDVGGWAQLKKRVGPRLEFNGAYGIDNSFASEIREYVGTYPTNYLGLARNQTFFANTIYSPSAYLMFSLEFKHIWSAPITGPTANSNIIGIAAGYKF